MSDFNNKVTGFELFGWLMCLIVPMFLMRSLQWSSLSWGAANFVVIFSAALMMWVFRLVPEYVPAVFIIFATVLLGLAPEQILLSGFASESFFLALSVFGLGAVIIKSGIFYRLSLLLLLHLPKRVSVLQGLVFTIGAIITPLLSAQSSRVALMAPFLEDLSRSANFKPKSALANSLVCCAFQGTILLSAFFLTGKSSNFVLLGMLSKQMQWQFGWLSWFIAASLPGLLLVAAFFILVKCQFKPNRNIKVDLNRIKDELNKLGALSRDEWASCVGCIALMVGLLTSSVHHISSAWLCFSIFFVLLLTGVLNKGEFKLGINWPFLFYLGALIGITRCIQVIGIDEWFVSHLTWLEDVAEYSNMYFLMLIFLIGFVGSLLLGTMAAPGILFTILLPMAEYAGMNTWLIAFILLVSTESWIFPYQSSYYLCFEEIIQEKGSYQLTPMLKMNIYLVVIRFFIVVSCIPFWQWLEIL